MRPRAFSFAGSGRSFGGGSRGASLVELMVVVTIISLLMCAAIPTYGRIQRKARANALVNDFRVFAGAFQARAHATGAWPDETAAGVVPTGLAEDELKSQAWLRPTPIGGQFDWENNQIHNGIRYRAAVALVDTAASPLLADATLYAEVDAALDDGDLATGNFRLGNGNCLLLIVEP